MALPPSADGKYRLEARRGRAPGCPPLITVGTADTRLVFSLGEAEGEGTTPEPELAGESRKLGRQAIQRFVPTFALGSETETDPGRLNRRPGQGGPAKSLGSLQPRPLATLPIRGRSSHID